MPSLLLVVFLVELAIQLVNTLGATTINNLVRNGHDLPLAIATLSTHLLTPTLLRSYGD